MWFHGVRSMGSLLCGGEDGVVECFDMRRKSSVGRINTAVSPEDFDQEVTSLQFDENQGYLMAVGSSTGKISIYDLHMSSPLRVKDHMYGSPILNIKWHQTLNSTEPKLITADKHIVRVWDPNTEEMEEKSETTLYDDYKFLTEEEMERLGLAQFKDDNAVRRHLHGYVIRYDLYKKQRAEVATVNYEDLKKEMKEKKIEAQRQSRIAQVVKIPKVNRHIVDNILREEEEMDADLENVDKKSTKKNKRKLELNKALLIDPRFKEMFENKDFQIDEQSKEYLALHPQASIKEPHLIEEHFECVSEDEEEQPDRSASDASAESDSDNDMHNSKRIRLYEVKDDRHAEAFLNSVSLANEDALPLGDRIACTGKATELQCT